MNPIKIVLLLLIFFGVIIPVLAQEKMRVAVLDLKSEGVSAKTGKVLSNMLRTELINLGSFTIIERSQMDNILKEQGFQQTGCTDQECAVQLGRLMSTKKILIGEVSTLGDEIIISIRIVDVEKGIAEYAAMEKSRSLNQLDQAVASLTEKLSNRILNTKSTITKETYKEEELMINLNTDIKYKDGILIISNKDNFNWTNVELIINFWLTSDDIKKCKRSYGADAKCESLLQETGKYICNVQKMSAQTTYNMSGLKFKRQDGAFFNVYTTIFLKGSHVFIIRCNTPQGKGFWTGKWIYTD